MTLILPVSKHGHHFERGPVSEEVLTQCREQDSESWGQWSADGGQRRNHMEGVKEEARAQGGASWLGRHFSK